MWLVKVSGNKEKWPHRPNDIGRRIWRMKHSFGDSAKRNFIIEYVSWEHMPKGGQRSKNGFSKIFFAKFRWPKGIEEMDGK